MMKTGRILASALVLGSFLMTSASALATEVKPFTQAQFDAAKAAGQSILVEVTAPWCPTCKAQKVVLEELTAQPKFKDLKVFNVDFDSQKDALRAFKAQMQSTLIVYKGANETGRSTGDTNKASISNLLDKAL